MIEPVLLPARRVLQRTWQLKLHWDEKLPEDLLKDWNRWKEHLTLLNHVSIVFFVRSYSMYILVGAISPEVTTFSKLAIAFGLIWTTFISLFCAD